MHWIKNTEHLKAGKYIYFASDFHLGAPNHQESLEREKRLVEWLNTIKPTAEALFLVGDIFDFWFEYKRAVPRGFTRFLGKISEFTDEGIPVHFFIGNHDMWIFDYLPKETGMIIHKGPYEVQWNEKKFFIAHGDGLGPGDWSYKFLRSIFRNPFSQWLFERIHPNLGIWIARKWSHSSRITNGEPDEFRGEDKEMLVQFSKKVLQNQHFDYFLYGHRHTPIDFRLNSNSRYINLGDWIKHSTYAYFDGKEVYLEHFTRE